MTTFETIFAWFCGGLVIFALITFACATMNMLGDRLDEIERSKKDVKNKDN